MVFSSLTFVYGFLPLVFLAYFPVKNRTWRNAVLLLASLLFYSWGEPIYLFLMLTATLAAYGAGLGMAAFPQKKKLLLAAATVTLVGTLFLFKYLGFFAANLSALLGIENRLREIALPIGISFFTFQILSYVIDLYRGEIEVQKNYFTLLLYVSFFPQLIAGPIVRYQTVERELASRRETVAEAFSGTGRFLVGLAKKLLLANTVARVVESVYAGDPGVYGTGMYWLAAVAYALQIYFDFSGYSDMAIGLGRIFGFHFLENFNDPYCALSVTDFWRRWHISLSTWFRDYVYIPLGGNRVGKGRWIRNLLIVWVLTGFWHGAQWNFLLWGLYYGLLLLLEKLFLHKVLEKLPKLFRWLYAMVIVLVGWVLFYHTDMHSLWQAISAMFSFRPTDWAGVLSQDATIMKNVLYVPIAILACVPVWKPLGRRFRKTLPGTALMALGCLVLFALCNIYLVSASFNPFIYFRF